MGNGHFGIVVIGAGPRGTSLLERLAARLEGDWTEAHPRQLLDITVVDPYEPGPGHVWATGQPRLFLMNTPALFPTVAPPRGDGSGPGLTFAEWLASAGDGATLTPPEAAEVAALGPGSYPSRALYGRYLRHVHELAAARLAVHPAVAQLRHLPASALSVRRSGTGYAVGLDGGHGTLAADAVVLAVGHVPALPNPRQQAAGERADAAGLHYQPPNVPADVDWSTYPEGGTVLVRGLGLNFFDAMVQLTVGRNGEFVETGHGPGQALEYRASGREPVLHAASRRGTPYRAKAAVDAFIPPSVSLRHLSFEAVHALAAEGAPGEPRGKVGFEAHIWPLLHRDVLRTYYATLARTRPDLFPHGAAGFTARLDAVLEAPHPGHEVWRTEVRRLVADLAPEAGWLDVPALGHPFAERGFSGHGEYQAAVLEYLEEDARGSARGEADALKMAIGALNAGRMLVKRMVAEELLEDASRLEELQRWFEPLVEGLASGPPLQRIEELAALARAGVVQFIGPDPVFGLDEEAGHFTASSPWVDAEPVTAGHLLEAMMPANRVAQTASPLLRQLQEDGLARPRTLRDGDGEEVHGSGFDVVGEPYRLVDAAGVPHRGIFVLGLQLSSVQWGTAIAAEAGAGFADGARTLGDADAAAAELLRLAG